MSLAGMWDLEKAFAHMQGPREEPFLMLLMLCFSPISLFLAMLIRIAAAGSPAVLQLLYSLVCMMMELSLHPDGSLTGLHLSQSKCNSVFSL